MLAALALMLSACASTPTPTQSPPAAAPTTTWYAGTVTITSPDGAIPYGPPQPALIARTVDTAANTITEVIVDQGALRTTVLHREGDTNVFTATDDAHSFSGTLTMAGAGWDFTGWSYDLAMVADGGRITGSATLSAAGLTTEKLFSTADGTPKARIVDAATPVTQAEYDAKLAELLKK
jgi:hypothetical protein